MARNKCKACGEPIMWINTPTGKHMPCDPGFVPFWVNPKSKDVIVTDDGNVFHCDYVGNSDNMTGVGHIPHWATCPAGDQFRKSKKGSNNHVGT